VQHDRSSLGRKKEGVEKGVGRYKESVSFGLGFGILQERKMGGAGGKRDLTGVRFRSGFLWVNVVATEVGGGKEGAGEGCSWSGSRARYEKLNWWTGGGRGGSSGGEMSLFQVVSIRGRGGGAGLRCGKGKRREEVVLVKVPPLTAKRMKLT